MARQRDVAGGAKLLSEGAPAPRRHAELAVVSLTRDIEADGRTFPAGARGTIVAAYADGKGYEVEFFEPVHGVFTVEATDVTD